MFVSLEYSPFDSTLQIKMFVYILGLNPINHKIQQKTDFSAICRALTIKQFNLNCRNTPSSNLSLILSFLRLNSLIGLGPDCDRMFFSFVLIVGCPNVLILNTFPSSNALDWNRTEVQHVFLDKFSIKLVAFDVVLMSQKYNWEKWMVYHNVWWSKVQFRNFLLLVNIFYSSF